MRERWLSRRAASLHLGDALWVPFSNLATWWQMTRAEPAPHARRTALAARGEQTWRTPEAHVARRPR